jgi:hypothetical protein
MATNIVNVDPYLRTHWHFTQDDQLVCELTRSFNEVAIVTNMREIGTYALNLPSITGKQFYLGGSNKQQQSVRQTMLFTSTGSFNHNIPLNNTGGMVQGYGSYYDGTNWYGLLYASSTAISGQVSFYITPTQVVILSGAGSPSIVNGILIMEWISNP